MGEVSGGMYMQIMFMYCVSCAASTVVDCTHTHTVVDWTNMDCASTVVSGYIIV